MLLIITHYTIVVVIVVVMLIIVGGRVEGGEREKVEEQCYCSECSKKTVIVTLKSSIIL